MIIQITVIILFLLKIALVSKKQIIHNDLDLFIIGFISLIMITKNKLFLLLLLSRTVRICVLFTIFIVLALMVGQFWLFRLNSKLLFTQFKLKHNLEKLNNSKPSIILCNYPALMIEHLVHGLLPKKTCIVVWKGV